MIQKLEWAEFKTKIIDKFLNHQMTENDIAYKLSAFDNQVTYLCDVIKEASFSLTDYETNFKSLANKSIIPKDLNGRQISTSSPFTDASGFRFRGASFSGDAISGTVTDLEYKLITERYINGGRLLVDTIGPDDKITFQVVDKDNILGFGAGVVLDEFITEYFVPQTGNLEVKLDYPARIIGGLYVRLKYNNTGSTTTKVKCNLYLHWKSI